MVFAELVVGPDGFDRIFHGVVAWASPDCGVRETCRTNPSQVTAWEGRVVLNLSKKNDARIFSL